MAAERRGTQKRQRLDGKTISINGNTCRPGIIALPVALSIDRRNSRGFFISAVKTTQKKWIFVTRINQEAVDVTKIVPCHTDQPLGGTSGVEGGGYRRLGNDLGWALAGNNSAVNEKVNDTGAQSECRWAYFFFVTQSDR